MSTSTAAGGQQRDIPSYVYLPNRLGHLQTYSTKLDRPGQYAGWLGRGYDALATDIRKRDDKDNPFFRDCTDEDLDFRIKGLAADGSLSLDRLNGRRTLLEQFDDERRRLDRDAFATPYQRFQERALGLVTSERTRQALDIRQEPAELRDRYGRHLFGQSTLLARRLVEAGSRFVTVAWDAVDGYSWDSHVHSDDVRKFLLAGARLGPGHIGRGSRPARHARRDARRVPGRNGTHARGDRQLGSRALEHLVPGGVGRRRHSWRHRLRPLGQRRGHSGTASDKPRGSGGHDLSRPGNRSRDARCTTRKAAPRPSSMVARRFTPCSAKVFG